jgi:hypothetical protein
MAKFKAKTLRKMDMAVRKIALEMFSRVILKSPVDTGRFRGNWQVAIGAIPDGTLELDDKSGQVSIGKVQAATLGLKAGDFISLVNNLPYAIPLEEGSSQQAPAGMVALTVQEFQQVVRAIGLELSRQ